MPERSAVRDQVREPLINYRTTVIASEARQSQAMESIGWRLPRHFVPRKDELIRGSLVVDASVAVKWFVRDPHEEKDVTSAVVAYWTNTRTFAKASASTSGWAFSMN